MNRVAGLLRLEARDFQDLTRWRWVLLDSGGSFVADHEVRLDASAGEYEAFGDLHGYLRWHCAPDRRAEDEARIVGEVGTWIGTEVLGPTVAAALLKRCPATVRVIVPPEAAELLYRPLELGYANGKPLAVQDVTLVMESDDSAAGGAGIAPVGKRLRVLGLFSLPEGGARSLNLRRERCELMRLVRGMDANGKAADVRVLQYGVTRDRLRGVLEEAEGWDIIHVSGHGRPGSLTLETASGQPDRVSAHELADLLDPARDRLKLVTVSTCSSAAIIADAERSLLGLPVQDRDDQDVLTERGRDDSSPSTFSGTLASELAGKLGCAVLAMRYPVGDDFAIALSGKLYSLLAEKGQPLPRAVGMTMRELSTATSRTGPTGDGPRRDAFSALSVATPTLFGGVAADLRLAAPSRRESANYDTASVKMAGFPPEPSRLVGRTGVLARSSAVLLPESGVPGVLLHGMPGGGKTACALELAYGHEEAFDRLVWYKAPDEGLDISGALSDFALTLERHLVGFQLAHVLVSAEALAGFLPRLTKLMERRRLLIVIDNMESLLSDGGSWRDDRWGAVIGALCGHAVLGRVILTSRRVPAAIAEQAGVGKLRVETVDALSADEALLLARQLPNLSALKLGKVPGMGPAVSRTLARNAIAMAQGHPKLLELAESQAADPAHLLELVKTGDHEWRRLGGVPDGFFASDEPTASGEDYLQVLAAWTMAVANTLRAAERDLFWFLCCLEERDRERPAVESMWQELRDELGRDGLPSDLDLALAAISVSGLAIIRTETDNADESYSMHPGVTEAGRRHAGKIFQDAIDARAAAYWDAAHQRASGRTGDGNVDTRLLVQAGLAAIPYLLRQHQWDQAAHMLEQAFIRDPSRANAAAVLPSIEQITRNKPRWTGLLARVLTVTNPAAAEARIGAYMADAAARADYWAATVAAGRLITLCQRSGRLPEALDLAGQMAEYTRQAGLGPWTQLGDEVERLQLLTLMGQADQVLDEVTRLRDYMDTLPTTRGPDEAVPPWNVREGLLDAGRHAALRVGQWADALAFNAEVVASLRGRRAPATSIARARFGDSGPLMRLGRTEEALQLLLDCRQAFQDGHDTRMLGRTLSALASIEKARSHGDAALRLEYDALRFKYLAADVTGIAISYHNLGNHLRLDARQPAQALASHLAAALIRTLTGSGGTGSASAAGSTRQATIDVRKFGGDAVPPHDVSALCRQVGDIPGTDLPSLIARLSPDPQTAEQVLGDLIAQAQSHA